MVEWVRYTKGVEVIYISFFDLIINVRRDKCFDNFVNASIQSTQSGPNADTAIWKKYQTIGLSNFQGGQRDSFELLLFSEINTLYYFSLKVLLF